MKATTNLNSMKKSSYEYFSIYKEKRYITKNMGAVKLLLTGSDEDEMFPKGHYEKLFADIRGRTCMAKSHIFEHGGHPAMMSNMEDFISVCEEFFAGTDKAEC